MRFGLLGAMEATAHPLHLALAVLLAAGALSGFFEAVRFQWPESYFAAGDTSSYALSLSPLRYLAFRFLPVYVVCVFVAVSLARAGDPATLGALLVGATHAVITAGRAVVRDLRLPGSVRWPRTPLIVLHAVIFLLATLVAYGAAITAPHLESLIPSLHEVTVTLWTAVIAAVGGAYILQMSRGRTNDPMELARRSARKIPLRLLRLAVDLSRVHGADPQLVTATMIAENLQRPPWFRSVERIKGLVLRSGTYGIMQMSHDGPISDEESLRIAVRTRLGGINVKKADGTLDWNALNAFARSWNGDSTFSELIWACYEVAGNRMSTLGL